MRWHVLVLPAVVAARELLRKGSEDSFNCPLILVFFFFFLREREQCVFFFSFAFFCSRETMRVTCEREET